MGEIGRKAWISGLKAACACRNQPMKSPNGTPARTASENPQVTRYNEATTYFSSNPLRTSSAIPRATSTGVGKILLLVSTTARCQTAKSAITTPSGRRTELTSLECVDLSPLFSSVVRTSTVFARSERFLTLAESGDKSPHSKGSDWTGSRTLIFGPRRCKAECWRRPARTKDRRSPRSGRSLAECPPRVPRLQSPRNPRTARRGWCI